MSVDSHNESYDWGMRLGAYLRTLTPQGETAYEAFRRRTAHLRVPREAQNPN